MVPFAVADALKRVHVVRDGFKSRAEAERFVQNDYLAGGIITPPTPTKHSLFYRSCTSCCSANQV
jgi:hypothetical protein